MKTEADQVEVYFRGELTVDQAEKARVIAAVANAAVKETKSGGIKLVAAKHDGPTIVALLKDVGIESTAVDAYF